MSIPTLVATLRIAGWKVAASYLSAWHAGLAFFMVLVGLMLNPDPPRVGYLVIGLAAWSAEAYWLRRRWSREDAERQAIRGRTPSTQ